MDYSDTDDNLISPTVADLPVGEDESVQDSEPEAPARHRPRVLKPLVWLGLTLISVFFVAALDFMPMYYWMPAGMGTASVDSIGLRATILKNICESVAPSTLAASSNDSGIVSINPLINQELKPIDPPR